MPFAQDYTLVASTITTVTLDQPYQEAEIIMRTAGPEVFYTSDGSNPAVGGPGDVLPGAIGVAVTVDWPPAEQEPGAVTPTRTIKMISSGTPSVAVQAGVT